MTHDFEPQLHPVAISSLRPTQMTVGMREVAEKRRDWRHHAQHNGPEFLGRHMVPIVLGPKQRAYLIDNHHLVRALHDEGIEHVLTSIVADLSSLEKDEFWSVMDHRHWIYPFDAEGVRQSHKAFGKTVADLIDDPYRSLAGALRQAGGYAKDTAPYREFMWADFLRRRIDIALVNDDFDDAIQRAVGLARTIAAHHLPGWCGIAG